MYEISRDNMNEFPIYVCEGKGCNRTFSAEQYQYMESCPDCGTEIIEVYICLECGKEYRSERDAHFCCQSKVNQTLKLDNKKSDFEG